MRFVYLLLLGILLWSCSSLKINKATEVEEIKGNSIFYQLPQNQILLTFDLEKTTFVPGPYAEYSKVFLEIEPLQKSEETFWSIAKIETEVVPVADTNHCYILSGCIEKMPSSNFSQIINSNLPQEHTVLIENYSKALNFIPDYSELTIKKLMIEESKTSYKTVVVDSITKRIPIVNTVLRNKSKEEMAKDASKILTKIRKRKFRLLAALNDKLPKAGALKIMLEELDKKEQYYLELFMGTQKKETHQLSIAVLPSEYKKYMLFYFDTKEGIIADKTKGNPVWLNIEENLASTKIDYSTKYSQSEKLWPYRVPEKVSIAVLQNKNKVLETQVSLAQFGQVNYLPLGILKNTEIKLDSKTGALLGIEK